MPLAPNGSLRFGDSFFIARFENFRRRFTFSKAKQETQSHYVCTLSIEKVRTNRATDSDDARNIDVKTF